MASLLSCLLLLCVFAAIESRTFRFKNIPITPEGISLRILVKEDAKTGLPVASLKIATDGGRKHATLATSTENLPSTQSSITTESQQKTTTEPVTAKDVPEKIEEPEDSLSNEPVTFESRFGIGDVKCPKGRKRIGRLCYPLS